MSDSNNHNKIFGRRLKELRLDRGLSQKQLGILAGIDEFVASTRVNRYEKGVHQAGLAMAKQLADVLEVPMAYFYTEDDALAQLVNSWGKLDVGTRDKILSLISSHHR